MVKSLTCIVAGSFIGCVRCPNAYHLSDKCMPAGCAPFTRHHCICPEHINREESANDPVGINFNECSIVRAPFALSSFYDKCVTNVQCAQGGLLTCCNSCPAAVHPECLYLEMQRKKVRLDKI